MDRLLTTIARLIKAKKWVRTTFLVDVVLLAWVVSIISSNLLVPATASTLLVRQDSRL